MKNFLIAAAGIGLLLSVDKAFALDLDRTLKVVECKIDPLINGPNSYCYSSEPFLLPYFYEIVLGASGDVFPGYYIDRACLLGGLLCYGPFSIPPMGHVDTPRASLSFVVDNLRVGSGSIGPIPIVVPTPFGPFPITICETNCEVPNPDSKSSITVGLKSDLYTFSYTVPINL